MSSSRIGNTLRSARERAGWTREALAYHSGLSCAAIAQIESGRRQHVRLDSLVALANALVVSVDYLVGGTATVSPSLLEHRVLIYGSDDEYLASVVPFLVEGITRSDCALVVTTSRQIGLLRDALRHNDAQVEFVDSADWYRSPTGALSDYQKFVAERFELGAPWIRIIGEPIWAGRSEAEIEEWTRYESMINLSFAPSPATIVCPYNLRTVPEKILDHARQTHPKIAEGGATTASPAYREPEDFLLSV